MNLQQQGQLPDQGFFSVERDLITATGPEAASYLHSQVSNDIADMAVGEARWSFVLQPQGKVDAFFRVVRSDDQVFVLDTDAGWGQALLDSVARFKLRTKVDFELASSTVITVFGADATTTARARLGAACVDRPWSGGVAVDIFDTPADLVGSFALEVAADAAEALGVAHGLPTMGRDITQDTIPNETDLIDIAVSFSKGCYRGQELVERIHARGGRRRLLRRVTSVGPMSVGDAVDCADADGQVVAAGNLTSVASAGDSWFGLAYLTGWVEPGAEATIQGRSTTVASLF
ncbi:MAG: folate-binding protein YgfZ [Acidimicrobiales bacterium]|nr:folate-binding protein YgfZ [Acidimicrobiales bacterium]